MIVTGIDMANGRTVTVSGRLIAGGRLPNGSIVQTIRTDAGTVKVIDPVRLG